MKKTRGINLSLLTSTLAFSCSTVTPEPQRIGPQQMSVSSFFVKIQNYNGSLAYGHNYVVTPERITITWFGDLEDEQPKVVFDAALSPQHREQLANLLQRLDVHALRGDYVDPEILDGLQLSFEVTINRGPMKSIHVANMFNRELYTLVQQVNRFVPDKYEIHYSEPSDRDG
jgi:hypothetical protein